MPQDTIISDLTVCLPADRLDRGCRPGTWRLVDYEVAASDDTPGFVGTMVYAGPGMDAGELTLPLDASGPHAIHLGVHYPGQFGQAHVRVRLTDDPAYTLVRAETQSPKDMNGIPEDLAWSHTSKAFRDFQVSEAFWKVADLSGQDLVISRFNQGGRGGAYGDAFANLVHVRLVPLTPEQVAAHEEELPRPDTRRLMAMNDGGIFASLRTREDIHAQFEPYRESDVDVVLWACFKGQTCTYRSQVGRTPTTEYNPFDRFSLHEGWGQVLENLEAQGIDFLDEIARGAHDAGLRIFPSLRLQGPKPVPVNMEMGTLYQSRPDLRCRDHKGRGVGHLSLAFPEVRRFWIDLVCEPLERGFDGVHVIWCRSRPFVLYEDPVIERFRQLHGCDPRDLGDPAEDDPRFWEVSAEFVTAFARELKHEVAARSQALGRPLEIAHNINLTRRDNLSLGVDVETWVKEGLVDYLMPHPAVPKRAAEWIGWLVDLVRGTTVKLYPDLYPRRQPPAASLHSGQTLYDLGCDGMALWDTYSRVYRISEWAMMKRIGHRDDLARWREQGRGNDYFRVLDFEWLGDRGGDPRYFQTDG